MSKTTELARHLERLHINNMYKSDFYKSEAKRS